MDFSDILFDFSGHFGGGVQNGIFRTLKCTFGVSGFRGSVAGRGVCKPFSCLKIGTAVKGVCRKVVAMLPQTCHRVVTEFVAKFAAKLSQSVSQHLHKFMSHCCRNPLGENPFSVLPRKPRLLKHQQNGPAEVQCDFAARILG